MMKIRHATVQDLDAMMGIYAYAREFMAATGNAKQWGATNWPPKSLIEKDIENGDSYLCVDGDNILAVFYYKFGKDIDPCYLHIEDGAWHDNSPYGVIHRIASAKGTKGAGTFCINWAFEQCGHLRIDTHGDNIVLQNLLKKLGFTYCGVIHVVEDNDPRLAFEKINKDKNNKFNIRSATINDLDKIVAVEASCFPAAEAASEESFVQRLTYYPDHFWLMFDKEKLIAFVDGFVTDEVDLTDEMYEKAELHNENGEWQMIFGVNTIPEYRKRGCAGILIQRAIEDARSQGRKGLVLTCKDSLVDYYAKFGFINEGLTDKSTHGGVSWNQMRLTFNK